MFMFSFSSLVGKVFLGIVLYLCKLVYIFKYFFKYCKLVCVFLFLQDIKTELFEFQFQRKILEIKYKIIGGQYFVFLSEVLDYLGMV